MVRFGRAAWRQRRVEWTDGVQLVWVGRGAGFEGGGTAWGEVTWQVAALRYFWQREQGGRGTDGPAEGAGARQLCLALVLADARCCGGRWRVAGSRLGIS